MMETRLLVKENEILKKRNAELEGMREEYETIRERMQEQTEELETIFDILPVGISVIGYDHTVKRVNAEMERILKTPKETLLKGSACIGSYCNADGSPIPFEEIPGMLAMLENRRIERRELGLARHDGSIVWTSVTASPIPGIGVVVAGADITEVRKREEEYRIIVNTARESIFIIDDRNILRFKNRAAETYMGGVAMGSSLDKAEKGSFAYSLSLMAKKTIELNQALIEELRVDTNGETQWFYADCQAFTDVPGNPVNALIICTDITSLKKTELELNGTRQELEQKASTLEETNIALKVLLRHQAEEKTQVYNSVKSSFELLVQPYLDKLRMQIASQDAIDLVSLIENNINEIVSAFPAASPEQDGLLSPTEIQIASLIRQGKTTKEITSILNISENTVSSHRKRIRYKLGLVNSKKNLTVHLRNADERTPDLN